MLSLTPPESAKVKLSFAMIQRVLTPVFAHGRLVDAAVGGTADRASTPWNKPDVMALG